MDIRQQFLPYCLQRRPDGRYAILNRRYKPIGFNTTDWITYEDLPILVKFKRLTEQTIVKLSCTGDTDPERIFLYDDGCIPTRDADDMRAYLDRLAILAKLQVE